MHQKLANLTAIVLTFGLLSPVCYGQLDGLYEFDGGGDGSSWDVAANWEQITDPNGLPLSGDPATPPSAVTSANIPLLGVVVDMPGQTALDVHVGVANGSGSLVVNAGGEITLRDLNVGADGSGGNAGAVQMTGGTLVSGDDITLGAGSVGTMTMSGGDASTGDDFFINADGSMNMTGGTLFVGDRLVMENAATENAATLLVDGGAITADDDFYFFGESQVTVNSGSMIVFDKLRFDDDPARNGKLTINGGLVRSNEFGLQDDADPPASFRGVVEINGSGVYQVESPSSVDSPITQLSVAQAKALIAQGVHLTTSAPSPLKLGVQTVVVPEFDGRQDVVFTQISVVPEPAALLLLCAGGIGLALWRRRA